MGFFNLHDVVKAHKAGILESYLATYSVNDLVVLKHEMLGCAEKEDLLTDLNQLVEDLEFIIDEKLAAARERGRRADDKE